MPTSQYITQFAAYMKGRKALHTQRNYLSSLERYLQFLKGRTPTESNLQEFINHLAATGSGTRSLNRHLSALKTFFKHTMRIEIKLESYMIERLKPIWLNHKETKLVQDACKTPYEHCVINVFLKMGLRVSEAAFVKLEDIGDDGRVRIMGKGSKERWVYCAPALRELIDHYIETRKETSELLFPKGIRNLESTIQDVVKRTSIKKHISAHKLRHTFASRFYEERKDIAELRDILGHTNIATTSIYVHVNEEEMMKNMPDFMKRI